jgi:DNA repair protein RadC
MELSIKRKPPLDPKRYIQTVKLIRVAETPTEEQTLRLPSDCARLAQRWLLDHAGGEPATEFFCLMNLNTRNRILNISEVSAGTLNGSLVHPREVFVRALLSLAGGIVVFHNHPSGDPTPSQEDRELTLRLQRAGQTIGVELLDHVVLGNLFDGKYFSFKEGGLL